MSSYASPLLLPLLSLPLLLPLLSLSLSLSLSSRVLCVSLSSRLPSSSHLDRRSLVSLWKSEGVDAKWKGTTQFKKRNNRALRATATDFDRFQVTLAKQERSKKRKAA